MNKKKNVYSNADSAMCSEHLESYEGIINEYKGEGLVWVQ